MFENDGEVLTEGMSQRRQVLILDNCRSIPAAPPLFDGSPNQIQRGLRPRGFSG